VAIDAEIEDEIAAAISFAEESPFPTADALETHVFAGI
jgi:TPP-dependent pyruvate/acetoin dehydrogenase alpha subunit